VWTEDGKIKGYMQTHLKDMKKHKDEKKIRQPIQAIDRLSIEELPIGSKVKEVQLGYINLIQQDLGEAKAFAPAWQIIVEEDDDETHVYFVNAFTGEVQTLEVQNDEE